VSVTVKLGEKFTYSFPMTKSGYSFCGWYLDEALTQKFDMDFTQDEAKDFNIYAKWVPENEAATLVVSGATVKNKVFAVLPGETFIEPIIAEKEGYIFAGWYADEAFTKAFDFSAPVEATGKVTVYAKWDADPSATTQTTETTSTTAAENTPGATTDVGGGDNDNTPSTTTIIVIAVIAAVVLVGVVAVIIVKKNSSRAE
ncbi:MAG: InlB B-repeat-containing protein, partial [Eubacteriales bacterium]